MRKSERIEGFELADKNMQKLLYRCKCGHSLYIPADKEYNVCYYCGNKVTKQDKSIYDYAFMSKLQKSYQRFKKRGNENENR